jgi:hypothetical protein
LREDIPQGLKPHSFLGFEKVKAEALAYLDARARATAIATVRAKARATATARAAVSAEERFG